MKKQSGVKKNQEQGMTINEVAHYWKVSLFNEYNQIRVQCNSEGKMEYWNADTGEVILAKDLNR